MNTTTNPKVQDREPGATGGTDALPVRPRVTPGDHAKTSKEKPIGILDLGHGPHGKTVTVAFTDGWSRTLDLIDHNDTWHPLFSGLKWQDRNRLDAHNPAPVTEHPDGTRSQQDGPLSFVREYKTKRGKWIKTNKFDVPAQDYLHGGITGYRAALELIEVLKSDGDTMRLGHHLIIEEAFRAQVNEPFNGTNRRAAASAFTSFVSEAVTFASKHANWGAWFQSRIEGYQKHLDYQTAKDAQARADFVIRMKAAREAKLPARNRTGA